MVSIIDLVAQCYTLAVPFDGLRRAGAFEYRKQAAYIPYTCIHFVDAVNLIKVVFAAYADSHSADSPPGSKIKHDWETFSWISLGYDSNGSRLLRVIFEL